MKMGHLPLDATSATSVEAHHDNLTCTGNMLENVLSLAQAKGLFAFDSIATTIISVNMCQGSTGSDRHV